MITTLSRSARRTISVSFFVLLASSFALAQPNPPKPYKAHLVTTTTSMTPVSATEVLLTYVATGQGTHVGLYTESGSYVVNLVTFTFAGSATATAADGSTFSFTIAGGFTGATTLEGTASVTDGTGRFAGATGELTIAGEQTSPINIAASIGGWLQF